MLKHQSGPDLSTGISGQEAAIILHDKSRHINRDFYFPDSTTKRRKMNTRPSTKKIEDPGKLSPDEEKKWLDLYDQLDDQTRRKVLYLLIDQLHTRPVIINNLGAEG